MTTEPHVSPNVRRLILWVDRITISLSKHWLLLANVSVLLFIGLPVLAPVLMHYGLTGPAQLIYAVYRLTCHELAYRTYFFFGAQPVYTIEQLQAAFGVPANDLSYWSSFVGNASPPA